MVLKWYTRINIIVEYVNKNFKQPNYKSMYEISMIRSQCTNKLKNLNNKTKPKLKQILKPKILNVVHNVSK